MMSVSDFQASTLVKMHVVIGMGMCLLLSFIRSLFKEQ